MERCPKNDRACVVSVDIPLFDAPWGGLRVEDGYLIRGDGWELLTMAAIDLSV